jgi:hypothetical protein
VQAAWVGKIVMRRRFVLAMTLLGALSAIALAQSQSVVTIPLKPPPKTEAAPKPAPKATQQKQKADGTETVASMPARPAEPLSPQAIIEIPPPAFTTEPLFPNGIPIDTETVPAPEIEASAIEANERPPAEPPPRSEPPLMMPRPKPEPPARAIEEETPAPPVEAPPAAPPPAPRTTVVKEAPPAPATEKRPLRRGEMEPIDDYRPPAVVINSKALDRSLMPANEKPAMTPQPQPKPAAPSPKAEKQPPPRGEMMPVDDIPGGKSYKAPRGSAATFRCFVRDVMAFYDRTHIRCYNKAKNKLNFFAVDTSQPISESLVAKGLAAMKSGKPATVTFAPEADLNPSNCAAQNCRRLIDIQN